MDDDIKMRAGQLGLQPVKIAGPTAKLWASGPRARSNNWPEDDSGGGSARDQGLKVAPMVWIRRFQLLSAISLITTDEIFNITLSLVASSWAGSDEIDSGTDFQAGSDGTQGDTDHWAGGDGTHGDHWAGSDGTYGDTDK